MLDDPVTTAELLAAWREASRAAELADRLAEQAHSSAERADINAATAEEVAALAEQVAEVAASAAARARSAAEGARALARRSHDGPLSEAARERSDTRAVESQARDAYHLAEERARSKGSGRDPR